MKAFTLALALVAGSFFLTETAQAGHCPPVTAGVSVGVNVGFANGFQVVIGAPGFNQRYIAVAQVWVNEPYIYWTTVRDPFTGRIVPVRRVGVWRHLTWLYLDQVTGNYGYFDSYGNPIRWYGGW